MDEEIVEYIHIRILFSGKKQWLRKFCMQMDGIENTILSEVNQSQKDEHGMYSLIIDF